MTASAVSHRSVQGSNRFAEEKRGPSIHSRLLTVFEVSEILQVPRSWVYAHVRPAVPILCPGSSLASIYVSRGTTSNHTWTG